MPRKIALMIFLCRPELHRLLTVVAKCVQGFDVARCQADVRQF